MTDKKKSDIELIKEQLATEGHDTDEYDAEDVPNQGESEDHGEE